MVAVVPACTAAAAIAQNSLRIVEPLPGYTKAAVSRLSADGRYAVGRSTRASGGGSINRATRWDVWTGIPEDLGVLPGQVRSSALAISEDGTTVCGACDVPLKAPRAFRWTLGQGMEDAGPFLAGSMSADGSVLGGADHGIHPVVRSGAGPVEYLPCVGAGGVTSINAGGELIVGSTYRNPMLDQFAAIWYRAEGGSFERLDLPALPGGTTSWLRGITRASSVTGGGLVIGSSKVGQAPEPFYFQWLADGSAQMTALAVPPGADGADAWCISGAGELAGGIAYGLREKPSDATRKMAVVWEALPEGRVRDLRWFLKHECRVEVGGWRFQSVLDISADAGALCGECTTPQGDSVSFIAIVPERFDPPACEADYDASGFVDRDDFDRFVQDFESGDDLADFDRSGLLEGIDLDAFLEAFERGC